MGKAKPMLMQRKISSPIMGELKSATDRALPRNGAVQGVAMRVVNMPFKTMLLLFLVANFGSGIWIKFKLIAIRRIKSKMSD